MNEYYKNKLIEIFKESYNIDELDATIVTNVVVKEAERTINKMEKAKEEKELIFGNLSIIENIKEVK